MHFSRQAIQDITRTYEIPPEEIVTLIYDKIDVNGEGKTPACDLVLGFHQWFPDVSSDVEFAIWG